MYKISVFTASSFACHDLMNWVSSVKEIRKKGRPLIRYVLTKGKANKSAKRAWQRSAIRNLFNEGQS